jgi:dTDP-4-dehydrorhamnose reductase
VDFVLRSETVVSERWLILGADGLLGGSLRDQWRRHGRSIAATHLLPVADPQDALRLDLAQPCEQWPELPSCEIAVLCAAITNLDFCRRNPAETRFVNVCQTVQLAERLAARGCFVIFISSNLVFEGASPRVPPGTPHSPVTEYGRQKAEAEGLLAGLKNQLAVVRLTKVIHPSLALVRGWRENLAEHKEITPYSDFRCSPITLASVLSALTFIAQNRAAGTWQLSGTDDVSYAQIAEHLVRRWRLDPELLRPISCRGDARIEHVPDFTTLDASNSRDKLGFEIPEPMAALDQAFTA